MFNLLLKMASLAWTGISIRYGKNEQKYIGSKPCTNSALKITNPSMLLSYIIAYASVFLASLKIVYCKGNVVKSKGNLGIFGSKLKYLRKLQRPFS